jgi:hypothetical protein
VQEQKPTASGVILDSLWLWAFFCLLTLFTFLVWAIIEIQNHYYFVTAPFSSNGVLIK